MAVQARLDIDARPFILSGEVLVKDAETIQQDAGRTAGPLVRNTLMAQIAASERWVPFSDETATDGTALAKGLYIGDDIPEADIIAGNVEDAPIIVGGAAATFDSGKLVIENSKTLDTVVGGGTIDAHRVEDDINRVGLYAAATTDISGYENA